MSQSYYRCLKQFSGTCPVYQWSTPLCWTHPAGRRASGEWWCCRSPRQPASPPFLAHSWSSGTPSMTPGPGYSSRWSTEGSKMKKTPLKRSELHVFVLICCVFSHILHVLRHRGVKKRSKCSFIYTAQYGQEMCSSNSESASTLCV